MKILKANLVYLTMAFFIAITSCSESDKDEKTWKDGNYIELSQEEIRNIPRMGGSFIIDLDTNVDDIILESNVKWCAVEYNDRHININITTNSSFSERTTQVKVYSKSVKGASYFSVYQKGVEDDLTELKEDIKQKVKWAEADNQQPICKIDYTYDGNYSGALDTEIYFSRWKGGVDQPNYFPITLQYYFEDVKAIDYIVYYPITKNTTGRFQEVEIWAKSEGSEEEIKVYHDDFGGLGTPKRVDFEKSVPNPVEIKFIIHSGTGAAGGNAGCAQMDFFMKNPENFEILSIFKDHSCSEIKPGVSLEDIKNIVDPLFKNLALDIFNNTYDKEFRIQTYQAYQHPDIQAAINKTSPYGLRDNPTGIFAKKGEDIIVFCEEPEEIGPSIFIQNPEERIGGTTYMLQKGLNRISTINHGGLIYITYYTNTGKEKPLKINFLTGEVNGYFDSSIHKRDEWTTRLYKAKFRHFDVKGEKAVLTFDTEQFKEHTKNGFDLIQLYDEIVSLEQKLLGLEKYKDKAFKNRAYFVVSYRDSDYMYASSYHMAYHVTTLKNIIDETKMRTSSLWGPAHELGHVHQTRPGLKWKGMTEVTNNICALYVQTTINKISRLQNEKDYEKAIANIVDQKKAHNAANDFFQKLVPFWQLKLYMHDVLGNEDFYPDLYETIRNNPNPASDGKCQLEFIKHVCNIAKLDMTEFFDQWGFLRACDFEIDDYGKAQFVITQEEIDETLQYIKSKNYPKPKHNNIYKITDENWKTYK